MLHHGCRGPAAARWYVDTLNEPTKLDRLARRRTHPESQPITYR